MNNLRTGDIAYFDNDRFRNYATESVGIDVSGHTMVIFSGPEYDHLSICKASPSHLYTARNEICFVPLEEDMTLWWKADNCNSCHIIKRIGGKDIPADEAIQVYSNLSRNRHRRLRDVPIGAVMGWLGFHNAFGIEFENDLCSTMVTKFLQHFGVIDDRLNTADILPENFMIGKFGNRDPYEKTVIFDKGRKKDVFHKIFAPSVIEKPEILRDFVSDWTLQIANHSDLSILPIRRWDLYRQYGYCF